MNKALEVLLTSLPKGKRAEVSALDNDESLKRRMLEMGIIEGAFIEILHEGLIGKDPIAVRIDDRIIALRRNEASTIRVHPIAEPA